MGKQSVFQLVYVSNEARHLEAADLSDLLVQSREKNSRLKITGLLLYMRGSFIQLIEGPESNIRDLYRSIKADRRHEHVTLLYEQPARDRDFPTWSMGFRGSSIADSAAVELSAIFDPRVRAEFLEHGTSAVRRLLTRFYDSNA